MPNRKDSPLACPLKEALLCTLRKEPLPIFLSTKGAIGALPSDRQGAMLLCPPEKLLPFHISRGNHHHWNPPEEPVPVLASHNQMELLPFHTLPMKRSHQCQLSQDKEPLVICPSTEGVATVSCIPKKLVSLPKQRAIDIISPQSC